MPDYVNMAIAPSEPFDRLFSHHSLPLRLVQTLDVARETHDAEDVLFLSPEPHRFVSQHLVQAGTRLGKPFPLFLRIHQEISRNREFLQ